MVAALASLRKGGVVAINAIHLDRIPEFDYDRLLWGERQIRSVANMTRSDAHDFLQIAGEIGIQPQATVFPLKCANEALAAVKSDSLDGAAPHLAQQINQALGQRVVLHYSEHRGVPSSCFGQTGYFVDGVRVVRP